MQSRAEGSETYVVFEAGSKRLAFKALAVRRMMAGELWAGEAPLQLGELLGVGPGLFERRTRVLELETSLDEAVPVLARGPMSIRTVPLSQVRAVEAGHDGGLQGLINAIIDDGDIQVIIVEPDAVNDFIKKRASEPPGVQYLS
ncbi:MAG: hypothetical protein RJA70_928 [Pseudomonadota bacterium]